MTSKHRRLLQVTGCILAAGCLGLISVAAQTASPGPGEFGVRSLVAKSAGTPTSARIYSILYVQMVSSDPRNMPQVDEDSLIMQVCRALDTHGFRPAEKGQKAEVLITVHYGRAWLRNPYLTDSGDNLATEGIASVEGIEKYPNRDVIGSSSNPKMDGLLHGYEAKIQKASAEKLYLRLTGWRYPPDSKAKAQRLWQTTVVVDDPDRWNLNSIGGQMLAVGAPYFDREIEEKELEVRPGPPEGRVSVGALRTVATEPANSTSAAPPPASSSPIPLGKDPAVPAKKFDLPAGDAIASLQAFSRQSGQEIIYPSEQIRGIRTNAVRGEMSPRAALDRLLDGTGLTAVQDEKSDALAIRAAPRR